MAISLDKESYKKENKTEQVNDVEEIYPGGNPKEVYNYNIKTEQEECRHIPDVRVEENNHLASDVVNAMLAEKMAGKKRARGKLGKTVKSIVAIIAIVAIANIAINSGVFKNHGLIDSGIFSEETVEDIQTFSAADISEIRISTSADNIQISDANGSDIEIITHQREGKQDYKIDASGDKLNISGGEDRKKIGFINLEGIHDLFSVSVEVCVPKGYTGNIIAESSNSAIKIHDVDVDGRIDLKTSNSGITAEYIKSKTLSLQTSNSRVTLDDINADSTNVVTTNGKVVLENVASPSEISVQTSNSAVEIEDIESDKITVTTSNGSIRGNVKGKMTDYSISSSTSNGNNNLGESSGGSKTLKCKTTNGSIDVDFAD